MQTLIKNKLPWRGYVPWRYQRICTIFCIFGCHVGWGDPIDGEIICRLCGYATKTEKEFQKKKILMEKFWKNRTMKNRKRREKFLKKIENNK